MTTADEMEIRNLLARIAHCADHGTVDEYLRLFSDDVVWKMPPNPAVGLPASERRGHEEVAAGVHERRAAGIQGPGSNTMHLLLTTAVRFDDADTASAESCWLYYGDTSSSPVLRTMGRYHDAFRRGSAGWVLTSRTVEMG
jgi:hypothetical protein